MDDANQQAQDVSKHEKKELRKGKKQESKKQHQETKSKKESKSKIIKYSIAVAVIVAIILLIYFFIIKPIKNLDNGEEDVIDLINVNLKEHKNLALHIHPTLQIEIEGEQIQMPANIGISTSGMRVMHTHDGTGKIHIESPYPYQFHLKDWFTIWGRNFNSTCILESCVDESHILKVYVNDIENNLYGDIPLRDGDIIRIVYS